MWLTTDADDWLTEKPTPRGGLNEASAEKRDNPLSSPIQIEGDVADEHIDLRTLPEAPPCQIHTSDNVAYFTLKLQSKKVFSRLLNYNQLVVPSHVFDEIRVAHAAAAAVVFILFDHSSQTFEGYALLRSVLSESETHTPRVSQVEAVAVRRATVRFAQVAHVRDEIGLRGRSISTVRDGSRLGVPAARTLCRIIDKKAYNDDPIHYKDPPGIQVTLLSGIHPNVHVPPRSETDLLRMNFQEYLEAFSQRRAANESVPSLDNLVYR